MKTTTNRASITASTTSLLKISILEIQNNDVFDSLLAGFSYHSPGKQNATAFPIPISFSVHASIPSMQSKFIDLLHCDFMVRNNSIWVSVK